MKLYIPTTSLNFNNILSTESISPKGFYASRGFGYSRWFSIPENDFDGVILLYESPASFTRPKSDLEDHPLLIEIETDEDFSVVKEGIRCSKQTIYLNPWNTKFIFQDANDRTVALSLSDSSLETKMLRLYNRKIIVASSQGTFPTLEDISIEDIVEVNNIEHDRHVNRIKGLLYGYYIGACLSSSKDDIEKINILKEIQNIFAAVVSSADRKPSRIQMERLEFLFDSYIKKNSLYKELLATIGSIKTTDKVLAILQKYDTKVLQFDWRGIVNELQYNEKNSNYAISWIKSEISILRREIASHNSLLLPDAEEIVTNDGKISKITSVEDNNENKLYISWVNNIFVENRFNGKVSSTKEELADAITKSAIETLGEEWTNSPIRTFLNQLRKHVRGEEFTQAWNNGVLSSIAAVIIKGDDWENLLSFMQSKGMTDYRIAFSFYGILNGFANLTRDFTDILLKQQNAYVADVYREFYGQIHGVTIDINKKPTLGMQDVEQKESIEENGYTLTPTLEGHSKSKDLHRKEIWTFFNSSACKKKGSNKKRLEEGLGLCLDRYDGEIDYSQFIMDLNDYDVYGWSKSNQPWISMKEHFFPDYDSRLKKIKNEKAKESPTLFDDENEVFQQEPQIIKSRLEARETNFDNYRFELAKTPSKLSFTFQYIKKIANFIESINPGLNEFAYKQIVKDLEWVFDPKYASGRSETELLEKFRKTLISGQNESISKKGKDMKWKNEAYKDIDIEKTILAIKEKLS